jgi:hypothetical protein
MRVPRIELAAVVAELACDLDQQRLHAFAPEVDHVLRAAPWAAQHAVPPAELRCAVWAIELESLCHCSNVQHQQRIRNANA